ncbi:hypothetical protein Tco_0516389 [Tanacetum coccineum]
MLPNEKNIGDHHEPNEDQSVNDETSDHEVQTSEPYPSDSIKGLESNATDSRPSIDVSLSGGESSGQDEYVFVIKCYGGGGEVCRGKWGLLVAESGESGGWEEELERRSSIRLELNLQTERNPEKKLDRGSD